MTNSMNRTVEHFITDQLNSGRTVTSDEIQKKFSIGRQETYETFKAAEKKRVGRVLVGRRGSPTRIVPTRVEAVDLPETVPYDVSQQSNHAELTTIRHVFPLRFGLKISIELPTDLKPTEAVRLGAFISSLAQVPD